MPSTRQLSVLVAIFATGPLAAQTAPPRIGSPVRIVSLETRTVVHTGRLLWLAGDNVVMLAANGDTVRAALGQTLRLDLPVGQTSKSGVGAILGLLAGGLGGGVLGAVLHQDGCQAGGPVIFGGPSQICMPRGGSAALGAVLGGAVGAGIGAVVGGEITQPVWPSLDQPGARPMVTRQTSGGIGIGVTLAF